MLLMKRGRKGEAYNIGAGKACTMQSIADNLCSIARVAVQIKRKESLLRPNDAAIVIADASLLRTDTGWTPRYSLNQTIADTLDYWRKRQA